jgi:hypothetical protein
MFLLISLLLVAQGTTTTRGSRWDSPDVLIEDSLGPLVVFAADYNYTTGDMYVACAVDSGYYLGDWPGWVFFRSKDHGLTWEKIYSSEFNGFDWEPEAIDFVVTKEDTLYVATQAYSKSLGVEQLVYSKIYEGPSSNWDSDLLNFLSTYPPTSRFLSPILIRDNFEPFHLYRAFILNFDGYGDSLFVEKSTDKGDNWAIIEHLYSDDEFHDCDLTISDSTLYLTYLYTTSIGTKRVRTKIYKDRGDGDNTNHVIHLTTDIDNADIKYPRIGTTTTTPDNGQLVYTLFSQRNTATEEWDLLYKYSVDGGANWSSIDTIRKGSYGGVISDIRGYEVEPNQYMDITYCVTSRSGMLFSYDNYFRWSSVDDPTNWHDITEVSRGSFSSIPEIIYSPGASASEAGVVYNDFMGNLWFDAPWYSGIAENPKENKDKTRSEIVLPGSVVKLSSRGAVVYDVTGREITRLTGDSWDSKDAQGEKVKCGIYFIVNEKTGERVKVVIPIK